MVRMIARAVETGYDSDMPMRADVDPEMHKDAKAQRTTGYRDRLLLPLHYNSWGCGGPFSKWGFDDSYSVLVRDKLPLEDWQYAIARINSGYIGSVWPKIVWAPFWLCVMVGAILEGALHMAENSEFPVGMYLGILTAVGLLVSLIISKASYGMMQRDLARISATCSILTEQFRENGLSFDLLVSHGSTGRFECRLDIKRHVEDVEVEHVTLDVDKYTGKEDQHLEHVDRSGDRVVVYKTSSRKPAHDRSAGHVYRYGFGYKRGEGEEENDAEDVQDAEDEEDEESEERAAAMAMEKKKFLQPNGGFCGCKQSMRDAVKQWKKLSEKSRSEMEHCTTTIVWRNQRFKMCQNCSLPVFDSEAHKRAVMNMDVNSLVDYDDPEDKHIGIHYIHPNHPKTKLYRSEVDCCGHGWSSGMLSGMFDDLGSCGEGLLLHCCLVSETASVLEGRTTVYDHFSRYVCCCLLSMPCNACIQAVQRNKIRRMYGISVEDAPLGEYCDGQLHDYCVVQCCPCLSLIQHVNHLKANQKPSFLLCADEDTIALSERITPAQLRMEAEQGTTDAHEEKKELQMMQRHMKRSGASRAAPALKKKTSAAGHQQTEDDQLRFYDTAAQVHLQASAADKQLQENLAI